MKHLDNTRFFLLERFYYEYRHELKKFKNRLIRDKIYRPDETLIKECSFKYIVDKPNFKIIEELWHYFECGDYKGKILYVIDYKKMTERQTRYNSKNDISIDLKFFLDKARNLLRVNEYENKKLKGIDFYYDCNGIKLDTYYYIPAWCTKLFLKLNKEQFEEATKLRDIMQIST